MVMLAMLLLPSLELLKAVAAEAGRKLKRKRCDVASMSCAPTCPLNLKTLLLRGWSKPYQLAPPWEANHGGNKVEMQATVSVN